MPHEVFICYAAHDKAVAEAICAALESRHIKCWIAPRDVLPGTEWAETIVDALDGSRVIVLVLSSSSNTSPQVIREVGRAASNGTPIIPIRIDDVVPSKAMDYFVSSHQWLYAQTGPLKKHLQRLADTVQQILARKRVPQAVTEITDAEEKAKREAEEARKAREAEKRPPVFVKKPAKQVKVGKPLLKRWWLWAGTAVVLVALIFVFVFVFILQETAEQHYNAGVALLEEGQYEQAILELDKALELDPTIEVDPAYAAAYHDRGLDYSNQGKYGHAIADLTRAIELDPTIEVDPAYAAAYHDRGLNYSNRGKYDLAIADLTRALELDPTIEVDPAYAAAYHDQGQTYSNIKDDIISSIVGSCDTPGNANGVYIEENYAYIANGNACLQIIDITDKKNPNIIGSCKTPGDAHGLYIEGKYAYIADNEEGLQIIDTSIRKD
jgi:tetratricopeptide (TPR) repeat protein